MNKRDYLRNIPEDRFDRIIPERRKVIESASDMLPKYEYNANIIAASLHPKIQHVKVSEIKDLGGAKCYTLIPDRAKGTDKLAYFRAGQYISLFLKIGDSKLSRPYSICSSPEDARRGEYKILVKTMKDGFASEYINREFKVGTEADISAPGGTFFYEPLRDAKDVIGIAGGSGIAPLLSIARAVADGTEDMRSLTILYGCRTEKDILLKDDIEALAKRCDKIRTVVVLSDEEKEGYRHGLISADLISEFNVNNDFSIFTCGSQGMYDYIEGECGKLGLPRRRVRYDAYGEYRLKERDLKETTNASYELSVVMNDGTCRTVPAAGNESLLTALERAGIRAPGRCRSGECGFCRSKLVSGDVYCPEKVDKRRSYDRKTGYIHPCCTFPRSNVKLYINCEEPKTERTVKDMKKKERAMNLIMGILMSAAMGAAASFLLIRTNPQAAAGAPVPMLYLSNIFLSIVVGVLVALFVPLGKMGMSLARRAGATPPGMKFNLINSIPLSLGNTLIVSLILSLIGVISARSKIPAEAMANVPPFAIMWLGGWAKLLLPTLVISYILSLVLAPLITRMVGLGGPRPGAGPAGPESHK